MKTHVTLKPVERAREILKNLLVKNHGRVPLPSNIRSCKIWYDGNFTIALVNGKFIGAAKRNPIDKSFKFTGESFAISRAVKKFIQV